MEKLIHSYSTYIQAPIKPHTYLRSSLALLVVSLESLLKERLRWQWLVS